jgi:hypothetical protein
VSITEFATHVSQPIDLDGAGKGRQEADNENGERFNSSNGEGRCRYTYEDGWMSFCHAGLNETNEIHNSAVTAEKQLAKIFT